MPAEFIVEHEFERIKLLAFDLFTYNDIEHMARWVLSSSLL